MAPLPSPGKVVQVNLHWKVDSDTNALTRHFFSYSSGAPSGTDLETFAGDVLAAAATEFASLMPSSRSLLSATAIDLSSDMANEGSSATTTPGTSTGAALAPGTAVVVSHGIDRRYRGGHPRTYLPIGTAADIGTNGLWESASITAFDSAWGSFANAIQPGTYGSLVITSIVNVSYYQGYTNFTYPSGRVKAIPKPRTTPQIDPIVSHTVNPKIGSQRRRNKAQ